MKKILLALFLSFCFIYTNAQSEYYQVMKLYNAKAILPNGVIHIDSINSAIVIPILSYYMGKESASFNDIKNYYNKFPGKIDNNPFIEISGGPNDIGISPSKPFSSASNILSSIGGLDVTNIADGLAKFLVKRTKEELNIAFFSKFKKTLNDTTYRDLKTLFPKTWELLDALGDEIYDYNKYIQNLREAFQLDIKTLDENLPGIIPNHSTFFDNHFALAASLNTACYITTSLKHQVHPGDIIDNYPLDQYFIKNGASGYFSKNWSGAIQTLQLISGSLHDTSTNGKNYWVDFNKVRELVNNKDAFEIYLGLIYQVAKNDRFKSIEYADGSSFIKCMDNVNFNRDYTIYKQYISGFAQKVSSLNEMLKNYLKPNNDSIAVENYTRYFKSSVELIEYCTRVSDLPYFKDILKINLHDTLQNYFKITYETSDLVTDINRRNYSSAINHALSIYNLVRTKVINTDLIKKKAEIVSATKNTNLSCSQKRALKRYKNSMNKLIVVADVKIDTALINAKLKDAISKTTPPSSETDKLTQSLNISQDILQKLARYGTFMSTVATAKNSDDVEKAIEAAALPSGSSRIKRETPFNVSLNAYTGLFMGHEKIVGVTDNHVINNYGMTAPIGVAISTGANHWSYSAFISLIDIGAVTSFRFQNNDSVAQVPTILLKDIFSPGLFFSLGFPKCPLSFNLGAQVGPNLRNVNVKDDKGNIVNRYQDNVYWRFSASIVVDIPIFNFYSKSKN